MIIVQAAEEYHNLVKGVRLEKAAEYTLDHQKVDLNTDLAIVIGDDDQIQSLNRDYRGVDQPTDVLSFPLGSKDPHSGHVNLGDIIISLPRAAAQADAEGHSLEDELVLLVVHGLLHLLGYDHEEDDGREEMWRVQDDILDGLEVTARPND